MPGLYGISEDVFGVGFSDDLTALSGDEDVLLTGMYSVCTDGDIFVFVGVDAEIYTSDGTVASATSRTSGLSEELWRVRYSGGTFIACGREGGICRSDDAGVTWTVELNTGASKDWLHCLATDGGGIWIASGGHRHPSNTNGMFWRSVDDGLNWTLGDFGEAFGHVRELIYEAGAGRWVAIGVLGDFPLSTVKVMWSDDDGVTWTEASDYGGLEAENGANDVQAAYGAGVYVLEHNGGFYATSVDGDVWVMAATYPFDATIYCIRYLNGMFVAMSSDSGLSQQMSASGADDDWSALVTFTAPLGGGEPNDIAYRAAAAVPVPRTRVTWF